MMKTLTPLCPGRYYHIYNRGNNGEDLFHEERNYRYFLRLYTKYIQPIAETFAYCLLRNHFHFLVRIKDTPPVLESREVSQNFSNLFNAYAKAVNNAYARTGSLFEERFGRIEVTTDAYFTHLIFYIHFNPQKHGFVDDFREWPWSSYGALCTSSATKLNRADVLNWFGGVARFEEFHRGQVNERTIAALIDEDLL